MSLCKSCGRAQEGHNFRHPFIPDTTTDKWDKRFANLALHFATWSKDPSTQVGAVIVDDKRRVIGHGYNGFPRGVVDDKDRYADRSEKYPRVIHGEMNAILNTGVPMALEGSTLYVTMPPCSDCAKVIIQVGIKRVVVSRIEDKEAQARWASSMGFTMSMFAEAEINMVFID